MARVQEKLDPLPLPQGISEEYVDTKESTGLRFHILTCGYDSNHSKPLILLLHGFPEMAYSWRKVMPSLAGAGYTVIALDQRGYGRTTGWDDSEFDKLDLGSFSLTNIVRDVVALVHAVGYRSVHCVAGHDFGAASASMCALMRPDFFRSCILMSHPFKGSPSLPFDILSSSKSNENGGGSSSKEDVHSALANLDPPRKHYKWYNSTRPAASHWDNPEQGMEAFLRGYFHLKSADWKGNEPFPLKSWTAPELAKMPHYYIMPLDATMPQAIAEDMRGEDPNATKHWLSEEDLAVYVREWSRAGFQGGLNFYRVVTDSASSRDLLLFAGKKIEVPCTFISGEQDWGNYQEPGVVENMPNVCTDFRGTTYIDGASHWVQQEQPEKTVAAMLDFLKGLKAA